MRTHANKVVPVAVCLPLKKKKKNIIPGDSAAWSGIPNATRSRLDPGPGPGYVPRFRVPPPAGVSLLFSKTNEKMSSSGEEINTYIHT